MILDGKKVAEKRLHHLKERIEEADLHPQLATIIVGDDPASRLYIRMKHQSCEKVGIDSISVELPDHSTTDTVINSICHLNEDPLVDGILVQLPLPDQIAIDRITEAVIPEKDVDGFHPYNLGRLFGNNPNFIPCTPLGIMTLLKEYNLQVDGKNAIVVGRSIEVGRPCALLLLHANATVTICHSRTSNLANYLENADIIVSSVGKPRFITGDMVKEGSVIIDVGINYVDGKLCGDVDFSSVETKVGAITPVPGGVGPMTIAALMENTFKAAWMRKCTPVQ